jgi:hypothetical protein
VDLGCIETGRLKVTGIDVWMNIMDPVIRKKCREKYKTKKGKITSKRPLHSKKRLVIFTYFLPTVFVDFHFPDSTN